jgi:protein transport protein SEC24
LVCAGIDCEKGLVAILRHEERLTAGTTVFVQAALLYSALDGTRRVRVHTMALPVGGSIGAIFRGADLETVVQTMATKAQTRLPSSSIFKLREELEGQCIAILTAYRRHCAVRSSGEGQLILPESLKLLPLYTCMYMKSVQLAARTHPDVRATALYAQSCASVRAFSRRLLPRLVDVGAAQHHGDEAGWLPAAYLPVSAESISSAGIYFLENYNEVLCCSGFVSKSPAAT